MRSPNTLPPRSTSPASVSSAPPGSPALAGTADALQGAHAGAGPSTAPRIGQRRSARQAALEGPPVREAPASRQSPPARLRSAAFGTAPARRALISPQEMAGLQALLVTPDVPAHHGQVSPNLPSMQELLPGLAGLLDTPTQSEVPVMSTSDGFLPPLVELMDAARHGPAHEDAAAHGEVSSAAPLSHVPAAGVPPPEQRASRDELGLLERPMSMELIRPLLEEAAAKKSSGQRAAERGALTKVEAALRQALQEPQRRQALQRQGISLNSHGVDARGRPVSHPSQLTPLLEQAERQALVHLQGLSDADMPPLDRAFFMASMLREQLGQEEAVGAASRTLAQPAGPSPREKTLAVVEGGQLVRLAAAYAGKALGLSPENTELLRQRSSATQTGREFQSKLRELSERQGPLAIALVHQLYPPGWIAEEGANETRQGKAKPKNAEPRDQRKALVEALVRTEPGVMQRLIDAAHNPHPGALVGVRAGIEATMVGDRRLKNNLANALERLQGRTGAKRAYVSAPPADQALQWLRSKASSAPTR